jgi:hypothetical protein
VTAFALVPSVPCAMCADNDDALFRLVPLGFGSSTLVRCPLCAGDPRVAERWRYWLGAFLDEVSRDQYRH